MQNVANAFLEFFRLERKRTGEGLSVHELERWTALKRNLDRKMLRDAGSDPSRVRASLRVSTRLRCSFPRREDFDEATITNLSTGGVFIATATPLPIGEKLTLQMHVRGSQIEVEAVVVSNHVAPDLAAGARGMGLRFADVEGDTIAAIHDLYERELEREARRR